MADDLYHDFVFDKLLYCLGARPVRACVATLVRVCVDASSTGCWAGRCAGAAGTCAGASGRSSGAAAGHGA
eukprot:558796-Prymnesium_polylepis.1